jgi:predicted dehydrogenase
MAVTVPRIGLIGSGGIAARHASAYHRYPERGRLCAVADIATDRARVVAMGTGAAVYADYRRLLRDEAVDAVDICLPHHLHAAAIMDAVRHGKHVLCEKPLCLSLHDAERIARAVDEAGVTLMCVHNRLFEPVAVKARTLLAEGLLGRIYQVRATDCFVNDAGLDELTWRARVATCGGGELIDTGYHPAYLVLALAGGTPVEVVAMTSRHRLSFLEGEDSAQVLVRFDNAVVGQITTSWAYQAPDCYEHFSAAGERGTLYATRTRLTYQLAGRAPVILPFDKGNGIEAAILHFADCLATGTRPQQTHRDGAQVLAVILAAYESQATRSVTTVRQAGGGEALDALALLRGEAR